MENTIRIRPVGRPRSGDRLTQEERDNAKERHKQNMREWKAAHPEKVKEYRTKYANRIKNGDIEKKNNINILKSFMNDLKNVTIE